jgi:hypothetical protein
MVRGMIEISRKLALFGHIEGFGLEIMRDIRQKTSVISAGLAEREGFEPPDPCGSTVFKTAAFDRSATSPAPAFSRPRG